MTRVLGPSRDQLDALGDEYAWLLADTLAVVAGLAAPRVDFGSAEELGRIRDIWAGEVDEALLPALGVGFEVGAASIRVALREAVGLTASGATVDAGPARDLPARRDGQDGGRIVSPGDVRNRLPSPGQPLTAAAFTDLAPTADALAEAYLAQARNRLVGVGDELWGHAREELLEGLRAGEGVGELAARVRKVAPDLTEPRAEQLARTEILGAVNAGALAQVLATGASGTKTWEAAHDQRVRPEHEHADEQTVPLREKFTVGGFPADRPHDPTLPPHLSVSCRCALSFTLDLADVETPEPDEGGGGGGGGWQVEVERDRSFLERVFAKGLAFVARLFRVQTAAAMIQSEREFEPEGGTVTAAAPDQAYEQYVRDDGSWQRILTVEGKPTGDGRQFAAGALRWANMPLPLTYQPPTHGGVSTDGKIAGRIDEVWKVGDLVWGRGVHDLNGPDGLEAHRLVKAGFLPGVSVDVDDMTDADVEYVFPGATVLDETGDGDPSPITEILGTPELTIFHAGRIRGAALVTIPAFVEATLDYERTLVAAAHTITIPDIPPAWWFEEPTEESFIGAVTVTDEGRVHGQLGPSRVAHRGYRRNGQLIYVPKGNVDYGKFMNKTALVMAEDGKVERIPAGNVTSDCDHGPTHSAAAARKHYENSCSIMAQIRVGENEHGVWVAGALLHDVTAAQVARMFACALSGHWDEHEVKAGWRELTAALLVPAEGFPKEQKATVRVRDGQLVASAVPIRHETCACSLAASATPAQPDLRPVMERIAESMGRDRPSRQRELAARVRAGRS